MRARILNNGGYKGMPTEYPIEVICHKSDGCFFVSGKDLINAGADKDLFDDDFQYYFRTNNDIEVIEDENQ